MEFKNYFPIWNKLNNEQQERIMEVLQLHKVEKGTHIHDSGAECLGLVVMKSGHLPQSDHG